MAPTSRRRRRHTHTTHAVAAAQVSKKRHHAQVRGRLLPPPPLPGQAIARARSSGGLQAPLELQVFVLAERLRDLGGGRHGGTEETGTAAGHPASAAARAGAADLGAASTKTGALRGLLRPAAASVVLRRSAGATAVRSLRWRDGVVLCLRHAVGLPAAAKTVAGGVRGSRSGITISDA